MVNVTFSVPKELHQVMRKHSDIRWGEVARRAITKRAADLELLERLTLKSRMTMNDAMSLDATVKKSMMKKHQSLMKS